MFSDKSKLLGVHNYVCLSRLWSVTYSWPTGGDAEDAWCLGAGVAWGVKRWEVKGLAGVLENLGTSSLGPFQPVNVPMTSAAQGSSDELDFKYFSSEKRLRFLVLLSVPCHGNVNCFSFIASVAYWVSRDKDVKWAGPSQHGRMSLTVPCLMQLMGSPRRFLRLSFESKDFPFSHLANGLQLYSSRELLQRAQLTFRPASKVQGDVYHDFYWDWLQWRSTMLRCCVPQGFAVPHQTFSILSSYPAPYARQQKAHHSSLLRDF